MLRKLPESTREELTRVLLEGFISRAFSRLSPPSSAELEFVVGDVVEVEDWGGKLLHVKVDKKYKNIKNGQPGFTGTVVKSTKVWPQEYKKKSSREKWFYKDQVVRVVERVSRRRESAPTSGR